MVSIAQAALVSALQRAFSEAGDPAFADVAQSGIGVSQQQIREWRSGTSLPTTFTELEPLIAYLKVAAAAVSCSAPKRPRDNVTGWRMARWRQVWRAAAGDAHSTD